MPRIIVIAAVSYLLGSIPFGYLLVRIFRGEDVRKSGSGNIGATNVSRKSPVLGALTLILDAAKGFVAVIFAISISLPMIHPVLPPGIMLHDVAVGASLAALCAIVGHMFPVWLKFHGGKGVATALGAYLGFAPRAVLVAVLIFVVVVLISRRISLGSIVTAALFPSTVWMLNVSRDPGVLALIGVSALLTIGKHYENIHRLLTGQEPRFSLGRK